MERVKWIPAPGVSINAKEKHCGNCGRSGRYMVKNGNRNDHNLACNAIVEVGVEFDTVISICSGMRHSYKKGVVYV